MSPVTRRFRMVQLLFAGTAGALVGRAGSGWVEGALWAPLPALAREPRSSPPPARRALLDGLALARLTGLPAEPAAPREGEPTPAGTDRPVRSSLPVRLLGTLVNEELPDWSVASLQEVATLRVFRAQLGDAVLGAEVVAIERARVVVRTEGRLEYLDGLAPEPAALTRSTPAALVPPLGSRIRQVGPDAYQVPRAELEGLLGRLDEVAVQGRVMPVSRDGQVEGFRFSGFRSDSVYARLGLQDGDVVRRVNGLELGSADRLLELPALLREAEQLELELARRGGTVRTRYTIR